ncbi:MAG: insulinase family protein [Treponema sp.]|nr:insulinase family protein [Treponema sp.]
MKIYKHLLLLLLTVLIASCSKVDFGGLGKGSDLVPLNNKTITGALPNGLKYFILENSMPENRAHLSLVVNAGSVLENDDERGLAHFVEHLAFNDTARFPKHELIEYLRSLGMRFGADANAYTNYNETVFHFDVPVENVNGIKRIPEKALAILDDWTYAVSFKPEDVKSESLVVLEEMRARKGAMDRIREIILPILFKGSAYADRRVIGLAEIIENASSEQLKAFYDRWYKSDNMALVFTGDFDAKTLEAELAQHFNMPESPEPINRPRHELPPPQKGSIHIEIITDPEITSASFQIDYKQRKSKEAGTLAYYRDSIIDYLIENMLEFRFDEAVIDPKSSANASWGGVWEWAGSSRFFSLGTQPKEGNVEEALRELLLAKESVRRFGFTKSELERAKLNLISFMEKKLSEKDRTESKEFVEGFTKHFIYGSDMADIEWEVKAVSALLPGIKLREIANVSKNYFSYDDIVLLLIAPEAYAGNLPSENRIKEIFAETKKAKLSAKKDVSLSGDLIEKIPEAGVIASEIFDSDTNAYIITMANGAKIIFKETENKNNEIILYSIAKGGTVNADEKNIPSVNLLSEMIDISGFGQYSKTELANKLAGKQVSLSFWNSDYYRGFSGSSTSTDIHTLFEMINLFFTNPRMDENAIGAMLDQYRTYLARQDEDPQRFFSREITKLINSNNPLLAPLEYDDIDNVSVKEAELFLNNCLNPEDYTFVFTGNLNIPAMKEKASIYIGSIPKNKSMNSWIDPKIIRPSAGRRSINKGIDDRCIVFIGWFAGAPAEFNEQRNQVSAVLSEYLDIALTDEIREKLGGVYSISAGTSVSVIPSGECRISVYFVCNPLRVGELINAVKDQITNIPRQLSHDTFNKAKEALLKQHDRMTQNNLHIAQSYANSSVLYDTPLNRLNLRPEAIKAVTVQDLQNLCRQMLANGAVELVVYPEQLDR